MTTTRIARFWEKTYKAIELAPGIWVVIEWSHVQHPDPLPESAIPSGSTVLGRFDSAAEAYAELDDRVLFFRSRLAHAGRWPDEFASNYDDPL